MSATPPNRAPKVGSVKPGCCCSTAKVTTAVVGVGVLMTPAVGVGVGVAVGAAVEVGVTVTVDVGRTVPVGVTIGILVAVGVMVAVGVPVDRVGVAVGPAGLQ